MRPLLILFVITSLLSCESNTESSEITKEEIVNDTITPVEEVVTSEPQKDFLWSDVISMLKNGETLTPELTNEFFQSSDFNYSYINEFNYPEDETIIYLLKRENREGYTDPKFCLVNDNGNILDCQFGCEGDCSTSVQLLDSKNRIFKLNQSFTKDGIEINESTFYIFKDEKFVNVLEPSVLLSEQFSSTNSITNFLNSWYPSYFQSKGESQQQAFTCETIKVEYAKKAYAIVGFNESKCGASCSKNWKNIILTKTQQGWKINNSTIFAHHYLKSQADNRLMGKVTANLSLNEELHFIITKENNWYHPQGNKYTYNIYKYNSTQNSIVKSNLSLSNEEINPDQKQEKSCEQGQTESQIKLELSQDKKGVLITAYTTTANFNAICKLTSEKTTVQIYRYNEKKNVFEASKN